MTWQKCPVCDGAGAYFNPFSGYTLDACSVCRGAKIIDDKTGLPPVSKSEMKRLDCQGVVSTALGAKGKTDK